MADETETIDLQSLKDEGLTEQEESVVLAFESAFISLLEATVDEQAKLVASKLQKLVSVGLPEDQFESIWETYISIAKSVPYRHEGQALLINTLHVPSIGEPWKDLPLLGQCMRDNWIGGRRISPFVRLC